MSVKHQQGTNAVTVEEMGTQEQEPKKEQKTFTVEEAVETIGFGRFHIALFMIMGSTGVVEAMEIMLIAVVGPVIRCEWQLKNWQVALVTTMVFFGYMVASVTFGMLADKFGRCKISWARACLLVIDLCRSASFKYVQLIIFSLKVLILLYLYGISINLVLIISFAWGAYFSLLTSFSPSYIWFVFLRALVGCGVSGHSQGLIIKTEFLPTKYRGYVLPLSQIFWLSGSLLIIGLASVVNPTLGWRWLIRIASIPGILLLLVFKFIPESARYNVSCGNDKAALATLKWIAKMNRSVMPEGKLVETVEEKRGRFKDLFDPKYLRTSLQIWIIWLGISFAYYGVILASAELLEKDLICSTGRSAEEAELGHTQDEFQSPCLCHTFAPSDYQIMFISTVGEIALNPLNILGINFLGRRVSLTITMGCTAVFFLLLNICTTITGLIGFLFMLRAFVAANFNTIYIYTAEVYPTTMRAMGLGTSGSLCRIGAMVAPFIAQVLMNASFLGALCLFALVCIVCAISAFTLPIETKGRSLQAAGAIKLFQRGERATNDPLEGLGFRPSKQRK